MCTRPITIKQKNAYGSDSVQTFPCGSCPECLKDKQNAYKLRLVEESRNWNYLYFFTLTYSDESLPRNDLGNSTACVKDIQSWLKRFRIRQSVPVVILKAFLINICLFLLFVMLVLLNLNISSVPSTLRMVNMLIEKVVYVEALCVLTIMVLSFPMSLTLSSVLSSKIGLTIMALFMFVK